VRDIQDFPFSTQGHNKEINHQTNEFANLLGRLRRRNDTCCSKSPVFQVAIDTAQARGDGAHGSSPKAPPIVAPTGTTPSRHKVDESQRGQLHATSGTIGDKEISNR